MLKVLAYRPCTPSVLDIASVQNVKNSFLFFAVCELFSCNDNSHSGVTARNDVSILPLMFDTSRSWDLLEVRWRVWIAQTDPT